MTRIYTEAEIERQKKKASSASAFACALLGAALIVCIVLCTRVNTANARSLLFWTIGIFTLAGWIAIIVYSLIYRPCHAKAAHAEGLMKEKTQELAGQLERVSPPFHIPKSVTVRKVTIHTENGAQTLSILSDLAGLLPAPGSYLKIQTARSYIIAFEVSHEKD